MEIKFQGEWLNNTNSNYCLKTEFNELLIPKKDISPVPDGSTYNNLKTNKNLVKYFVFNSPVYDIVIVNYGNFAFYHVTICI